MSGIGLSCSAMRAVTVAIFALLLAGPSTARLRMIPYTDKELAVRGATLYGMLLDIARQDAQVSSAAFQRLAARTWAYQSLVYLMEGNSVEKMSPPPGPEGWRQLVVLLLQAKKFEEGAQVLKVSGRAFEEAERLFWEVMFLNGDDRSAERPAARLLAMVSQNPLVAAQLVQRWWFSSAPPFRDEFEFSFKPEDEIQTDILAILDPILKDLQPSGDKPVDTWTLMTPEAAAGQEILIQGMGPVEPNWKRAVFTQQGKSQTVAARRSSGHRNRRENIYRGYAVYGVPDVMMQGPARVSISKLGQFDLKITPDPAPARIESVDPDRVVVGDWMSIHSVGLQADRQREVHLAEKDKNKFKEWPLSAIFSQGGREWPVDRNVQTWRGWIQGDLVFRVPSELSRGNAEVKLKLLDAVSEPRSFAVIDWPEMENFERRERGEALVSMPKSALTLMFERTADEYAALVEQPSGRTLVWRPEVPAAVGQKYAESKWRIPEEWEIGIHSVVWAARIGGMWAIANLFGETLTVSPFAPAPENLHATFIRNAEGTITTYGANGYESVKYSKGDIFIQGQGIETGETYDITVRFNIGNVFSTRRVATHDFVLMVNVSPTGPVPEFVDISRVVADVPGMPANLRVRDYGGIMGDLFTAQTEEGKAAVEWLTEVRSKLRTARFEGHPAVKQVLEVLALDTFPASPWGGPWIYVRTPGHPSLTFLAHDWQGTLKAQFYSGGIGAGLVEYDVLMRGDSYGAVTDNLYWTSPWSTNGLGNLVCDAMRAATKADVAIHNTLGLRGNLPAGPVTSRLIHHILPFDNELIVLHLKGSDLTELLQDAFASGKFTYASGMTLEVDSGPKKVDVTIKMGIGKTYSKDAIYRVAMPSYLSEKRAGYPKTEAAIKKEDDGTTVRESLIDYIRSRTRLPADRTARILERTR